VQYDACVYPLRDPRRGAVEHHITKINHFHLISCICVSFRPVHGLIFLFKWKMDDEPQGSVVADSRLDKIFFAKQVQIVHIYLCYRESAEKEKS
jgi:hypothetical protein